MRERSGTWHQILCGLIFELGTSVHRRRDTPLSGTRLSGSRLNRYAKQSGFLTDLARKTSSARHFVLMRRARRSSTRIVTSEGLTSTPSLSLRPNDRARTSAPAAPWTLRQAARGRQNPATAKNPSDRRRAASQARRAAGRPPGRPPHGTAAGTAVNWARRGNRSLMTAMRGVGSRMSSR